MTALIQPYPRPSWKARALSEHAKAHMALRRAATAEAELAAIPKAVRVLCRIVCRMVRGRI